MVDTLPSFSIFLPRCFLSISLSLSFTISPSSLSFLHASLHSLCLLYTYHYIRRPFARKILSPTFAIFPDPATILQFVGKINVCPLHRSLFGKKTHMCHICERIQHYSAYTRAFTYTGAVLWGVSRRNSRKTAAKPTKLSCVLARPQHIGKVSGGIESFGWSRIRIISCKFNSDILPLLLPVTLKV